MKKPLTTGEFFQKICDILKEKSLMPEILDYALSSHDQGLMTTYEFDLKSSLDYGDCNVHHGQAPGRFYCRGGYLCKGKP